MAENRANRNIFKKRYWITGWCFFEGKRVTQVDLDSATAKQLANALLSAASK